MEVQTEATQGVAADVTLTSTDLPEKPDIQPMSASDAARLLRSLRQQKATEAAPEEAAPEAETESAPEAQDTATPSEEGVESPGETQEADAQEAPLSPPRSWSKEHHEHWNKLDRATQEYLLARDKESSRAVSQALQEAAEQRKAVEAERLQMAQARQWLENQTALAIQALQSSGEFADIRTQEDIDNLAKTDWPRWIAYKNHEAKLQALQQQHQWAVQQRAAEQEQQWKQWAEEQDRAFREAVPEISDKEKGMALMKGAIETLESTGFTKQELSAWWNGEPMSIRDARWQQIMLKAAKYDELTAKAKEVKAKPKPPVSVQKPGVAQGPGAQAEQAVKTLEQKLKQSGSVKDAVAYMQARRKLAAR